MTLYKNYLIIQENGKYYFHMGFTKIETLTLEYAKKKIDQIVLR